MLLQYTDLEIFICRNFIKEYGREEFIDTECA